MSNVKCRYCGQSVPHGKSHHCAKMQAAGKPARVADEDDGDFFLSLAAALATDNWLIGAAVGGSVSGGIVGDALAVDNDSSSQESSYQSSSSDSGGSSSSSSDSGSSSSSSDSETLAAFGFARATAM